MPLAKERGKDSCTHVTDENIETSEASLTGDSGKARPGHVARAQETLILVVSPFWGTSASLAPLPKSAASYIPRPRTWLGNDAQDNLSPPWI